MRQRSNVEIMCEENLLLVNAVKNFPCLYNFYLPEYTRKDDTDAAWTEVANCMGQTVQESKEKWRTLRYSFLRSLKPHPDGSAKKRYYLHNEMEFLIPFMKTLNDGAAAMSQYDSDDGIINDNNPDDEAAAVEFVDELASQDYCALEFAEPQAKRRKSAQKPRDLGNACPRKMFLLSLLPEINNLTEVQMKSFRRKVLGLIDEVSENNSNVLENNCYEATGETIVINVKPDPS